MLKNNIQDYFIFELEYKTTNESEIKLFDYRFVDKNKNKCKIIYNETEYDLTKSFEFNNKSIQNNSIKIKLKINKDIKDISHMFSNCKELLSIRDNSFYNYDITNIYEPFSNDSNEESNDSDGIEEGEKFYGGGSTLSAIQGDANISIFTGINDLNLCKEKILSHIIDMNSMFYECSSLISLPVISELDTKNVTNMGSMFFGCSSLISLPDISEWDTKNVTDTRDMFNGCSSLISLPDISEWDTKKVTDMSYSFNGCSSLISLPDISKWVTDNVKYMNDMFFGCSSLISLPDISKWDIKNVTDIRDMFFGCSSLTSLPDISKWVTKNVTDISYLFD